MYLSPFSIEALKTDFVGPVFVDLFARHRPPLHEIDTLFLPIYLRTMAALRESAMANVSKRSSAPKHSEVLAIERRIVELGFNDGPASNGIAFLEKYRLWQRVVLRHAAFAGKGKSNESREGRLLHIITEFYATSLEAIDIDRSKRITTSLAIKLGYRSPKDLLAAMSAELFLDPSAGFWFLTSDGTVLPDVRGIRDRLKQSGTGETSVDDVPEVADGDAEEDVLSQIVMLEQFRLAREDAKAAYAEFERKKDHAALAALDRFMSVLDGATCSRRIAAERRGVTQDALIAAENKVLQLLRRSG